MEKQKSSFVDRLPILPLGLLGAGAFVGTMIWIDVDTQRLKREHAEVAQTHVNPDARCSVTDETVEQTEADSGEITSEIDDTRWRCDAYLSFSSDETAKYVTATKDCIEMTDLTGLISRVDPRLADTYLNVKDYSAKHDELTLIAGDGSEWIVTGLADVIKKIPGAKVSGTKINSY